MDHDLRVRDGWLLARCVNEIAKHKRYRGKAEDGVDWRSSSERPLGLRNRTFF